MHELNDTELVLKIRSGGEEAFREIYDRYHIQMFYIAKKYVKSPTLAEDAVQDVFIKLWEKRLVLDEKKSIKGFLFTILKNHVLNMIRDKKEQIISFSQVKEILLPKKNVTEDEIIYQEYVDILEQGKKELSDRKREIFELKTVEGKTNSEVADRLGLNIRTVKTHYYLSSKFIKVYLHKHAGIVGVLIAVLVTN